MSARLTDQARKACEELGVSPHAIKVVFRDPKAIDRPGPANHGERVRTLGGISVVYDPGKHPMIRSVLRGGKEFRRSEWEAVVSTD